MWQRSPSHTHTHRRTLIMRWYVTHFMWITLDMCIAPFNLESFIFGIMIQCQNVFLIFIRAKCFIFDRPKADKNVSRKRHKKQKKMKRKIEVVMIPSATCTAHAFPSNTYTENGKPFSVAIRSNAVTFGYAEQCEWAVHGRPYDVSTECGRTDAEREFGSCHFACDPPHARSNEHVQYAVPASNGVFCLPSLC